jgi:hypothetical protein
MKIRSKNYHTEFASTPSVEKNAYIDTLSKQVMAVHASDLVILRSRIERPQRPCISSPEYKVRGILNPRTAIPSGIRLCTQLSYESDCR